MKSYPASSPMVSRAVPSLSLLFIFAMPAVMQGFAHTAAGSILTGVYAKYTTLTMSGIGSAILLSKIFDAVTDPLIGYLSDRHFQRSGSRKLWLVVGSLLASVALFYLFNPPKDVSYSYFLITFMLAYLGWTITEIPYRAWSLELTSDYKGRTKVAVTLLIAGLCGAIILFLVPIVGQRMGLVPSREFTMGTLGTYGIIVLMFMPVLTLVPVLLVRESPPLVKSRQSKESLRSVAESILLNKPYMYALSIFLMTGLAGGMSSGIVFIYVDVYMQVGEYLPMLLLLGIPITVLATPIWGWACGRFLKHRMWALGSLLSGIASLMYAFVTPFEGAHIVIGVLVCLNLSFSAASAVAMPSILGDISDYGREKFHKELSGIYYSFFTLLQKIVGGLGAAIALLILDVFGFDPKSAQINDAALAGLKLAFAYVPAVLLIASVPLLLKFPLGPRRVSKTVQQYG